MFRSEDGPRPDPAVLKQLRRVDPSVYPVWRNYWMDATTGKRLYREDGKPFHAPQWWIFKRCHDGVDRLLFRTPYLDNRVWKAIEADAARHLHQRKIDEMISDAEAAKQARNEAKIEQDNADFLAANKSRLSTILQGDNYKITDDRGMYRESKPTSFAGQASRNTVGTKVPISDQEAGWEMPWSTHE